MSFEKVAILGGGLLGGSLALALGPRQSCSLWCRRTETVEMAGAAGISGATTDLETAVAGADLVVLAVPVGAMADLLRAAVQAGLAAGSTVTDVGSVKALVHQQLGPPAAAAGLHLIGGHPMAGSERQGFEAAEAALFAGAVCLLTSEPQVPEACRLRLATFWEDLGCRVRWMSPEAHDALVARISHLPHILSAATASVAMDPPEDARYGGGGLRDTTRVAGGDPTMWAEILCENSTALLDPLRRARQQMDEVIGMLEKGHREDLLRWLDRARKRHKLASEIRESPLND